MYQLTFTNNYYFYLYIYTLFAPIVVCMTKYNNSKKMAFCNERSNEMRRKLLDRYGKRKTDESQMCAL